MNVSAVLVLNQNYEPLNACDLRRAMGMIVGGKAEILENGRGFIRSADHSWPVPSVIRLAYMIHRPQPRVRLCRKEIFRRDNYTCQYCGRQTHNLTMDHILPRHRGGTYSWDNLVSACPYCNRRKGGKTLEQARMQLLRQPFEPRPTGLYLFHTYLDQNGEWEKFLRGWWE
ncbi:MAG: HNH endonuclease [Chloroflexi bacterium]|nr:HNH endonuclease [Chloroflexota bacterium]